MIHSLIAQGLNTLLLNERTFEISAKKNPERTRNTQEARQHLWKDLFNLKYSQCFSIRRCCLACLSGIFCFYPVSAVFVHAFQSNSVLLQKVVNNGLPPHEIYWTQTLKAKPHLAVSLYWAYVEQQVYG